MHFISLFSGLWYPFHYWLVHVSFKPNHTFRDGSSHWTVATESYSPDGAEGAPLTNALLLTNFSNSWLSLLPYYIALCIWKASVFCSADLSLNARLKKSFYFLCEKGFIFVAGVVHDCIFWRQKCILEWVNSLHYSFCLTSVAWCNYGVPIPWRDIIFPQASWVFCLLETIPCLWNSLPHLTLFPLYIQYNCF